MDWQRLLDRATRLTLETPALDYLRERLPADVLATRRLTRASASAEQIAAFETRLGLTLPSSYREFLETTNGMLCFPGIGTLCTTTEADWFRVLNTDWCEILEENRAQWADIPRSENYPNDDWPVPYVRHLLQVSLGSDGDDTVLLNPQVIASNGEWEAYSLYSHGSTCHRSFGELIEDRLRSEERYYLENPEDPLAHLKPLINLTRLARAGQTGRAKPGIEELHAGGLEAAATPLAEIAAFEWEWRACSGYSLDAMVHDRAALRDLRLPALWAISATHLGNWSGAEAVLDLLPDRSEPGARAFHEMYWDRVDAVRRMIQTRSWSGLSWGLSVPRHPGRESGDYETRVIQWRAFCEQNRREYPINWKTAVDEARMRFTWALHYRLPDQAMQIAREHADQWLPDTTFEIGRVYAEMGRYEDAWQAILHALRFWEDGGSLTRVAPVELLIDPALALVMNRDRCAQVLATGRPPIST
jgi:hypothetical protein